MRRALTAVALVGVLFTVGAGCPSSEPLDYCEAILEIDDPPTSEAKLVAIHDEMRAEKIPELDGVPTDYLAQPGLVYFAANLDLTTIEEPPLERQYRILYGPELLDDPPSYAGLAAVLMHENKHIVDYTGMDADELSEVALWYATAEDVSEYERATDEFVLERGCGLALIEFREWLYEHVDEETLKQKMHEYYTPEEIEAWIEEHG